LPVWHQAKGQEWPHVAVALGEREWKRLAEGLSKDVEEDRTLYVALTRGKYETGILGI